MQRFIIFFAMLALPISASAQLKVGIEGGLVFGTNYNEVRIPNSGGTFVNLAEELTIKPKIFYRLRTGYTFRKRHSIALLYAPLSVQYKGNLSEPVNFNNIIFNTSLPLTVDYKFNSYRLTYRYDFISNGRWVVGAGLTAKIRDADIRFRNETADTHYDNLGFVPLVNFYGAYKPSYRWAIILEGDALASKYGRAEDIFAGVSYTINTKLGVKLGYRVVEGGADVDTIYNFNWINYASAGVLLSF